MESDDAGPRRGEVWHDSVDRLDHQVNVDRRGDAVVTQRLEHHWANRQVGDIVVIHNVEMDDICASRESFSRVFT